MPMSHLICNLSMVPLRAEPSDRAEMCSQILFGEMMTLIAEKGNWLQVSCDFDEYRGWIDYKQCRPVTEAFTEHFRSAPSPAVFELLQIAFNESRKIALPVVLGSTLPGLKGNAFMIDEDQYSYDGQSLMSRISTREAICQTALMYLNAPYLWGGRSPFGIDCSGLVQIVYRIHGFRLHRDAVQQAAQGTQVSFASEAEPGDVAFFENEEGQIIHTGIILQDHKIIHASGRVRIDELDHEGIYNKEQQRYTHKLRLIRSHL